MITVVPHNPAWSHKYENEAKAIASALGTAAVNIHHIGSTAIPYIFAKPVIDILIAATSLEDIDNKSSFLKALAYETMGEFGIPGRRYFRKEDSAGARQFHIHIFEEGSAEITRHLAFRDYLRTHSNIALQYSSLKRELVRQNSSDIDAYMTGKDPFIKATEADALTWRARS